MSNMNVRRKNRQRRNILLVAMMLVLVAVVSIGGTIAWLVATTNPVTNTFKVGDINITLTETTGPEYKIIPGKPIAKDPKVTVLQGSEKCWVFVSIKNELVIGSDVVGTPNIDSKWKSVGTYNGYTVYVYSEDGNTAAVVDAASAKRELPVFTQVTIDGTKVTKENIKQLEGKTIVIDAYAHQSEYATYAEAEAAAIANLAPAPTNP